jgi:glycosyltransferase involved in cell wall biosynthesis
MPRVDRWLLKRVARVVVQGDAEAELGQRQGLFLDKIAVIPPGIAGEVAAPNPVRSDEGRAKRNIVCIGPLEGHKGYRDALWSFDILRYVFDDVRLRYVGDGPERSSLERFGANLDCTERVEFLGNVADVSSLLAEADICWIPSRRGGGTQATLEAMQAGLPVVACGVPNLHGLIVDGHSGFVIAPGDKVNLARRTRQILIDRELARRLGDQARQRAHNQFAARHFVQRCRRTYLEIAA